MPASFQLQAYILLEAKGSKQKQELVSLRLELNQDSLVMSLTCLGSVERGLNRDSKVAPIEALGAEGSQSLSETLRLNPE